MTEISELLAQDGVGNCSFLDAEHKAVNASHDTLWLLQKLFKAHKVDRHTATIDDIKQHLEVLFHFNQPLLNELLHKPFVSVRVDLLSCLKRRTPCLGQLSKRGYHVERIPDNYDELVCLEILSLWSQQGEVALHEPHTVIDNAKPFPALHLCR